MRDLLTKPKAAANPSEGLAVGGIQSSSQVDNEKKNILGLISDDIASTILDVSFQRMLKKEKVPPRIAPSLGPLELWSDEFEGKGDFGQYRSRMVCFPAKCIELCFPYNKLTRILFSLGAVRLGQVYCFS